jgi:hypothetical protein
MTLSNKLLSFCVQSRAYFLLMPVLIMLAGCKKENNAVHSFGASLQILKGNNQAGIYGEVLQDTIFLKVSITDTSRKYKVKYDLIQGNGLLEPWGYSNPVNLLYNTDDKGIIRIRWRLGCNNPVQKVKFSVYPAEAVNWQGKITAGQVPLDTAIISASGQPPVGWGRSCGCDFTDQINFKIFTYNNSRLYMVNRGLYYSDDKGINWYPVSSVPDWAIVDAQFNSKGWLYIVTRYNGVYFSQDLISWQSINNGILDHRDPTAFTVEDSMLFVSFYFDGPYKTDNNGGFWRKVLVGGQSQRFYFIRRHPNGNLYLFDDWGTLKVSQNNGKNWSSAGLGYFYVPYNEYDFEIGKDGLLYVGAGDATISAVSPDTYSGERHSYYEWNAALQLVNNIQFFNNDMYYLVNYNPRPGVYSRNNNWDRIDLNFEKIIRYFYIRNDGGFLLAADAIYYKN